MKKQVVILAMLAICLCVGSAAANTYKLENFASEFASQFAEENNTIKYKSTQKYQRTIYIDATNGKDSNSGVSERKAIKSLGQLAKMGIKSGDKIMLKGGSTYPGTVELVKLSNIMIGSYGDSKAVIDCKGYPSGVTIKNSSNIVVSDVKITGDGGPKNQSRMYRSSDAGVNYRAGIYLTAEDYVMENFTIYNVDIRDVYFYNIDDEDIPHDERPCRRWGIKHSDNFSWGIKGKAEKGTMKNIMIDDCHIKAVSRNAVLFNGSGKGGAPFVDLTIQDCSIIKVGGPGIQFAGLKNGVITRTRTYNTGCCDDPRMWGRGSGSWLVRSDNVLYEHNMFERAEGIGDCCGMHIDIGNKNVVTQYCFSKDNAGGFIEILGQNHNCSYRYNISLNDGWRNPKSDELQKEYWRVKKEVANSKELFADNAAGSLGCVVTINGHSGSSYVGPYQSYVYNNTIVCTEKRDDGFQNPYVFQIATTSEGLVMMNNIFWLPSAVNNGWSAHQYKDGEFHSKAFDFRTPTGEFDEDGKPIIRDMNAEELAKADVVFKNNLYRLYDPACPHAENILPNNSNIEGSKNHYRDEKALGGDPQFAKSERWVTAEDMIPSNAALINQGMEIPKLKSDKTSYGVLPQLKMDRDFFGNKITTPIIGACVAQ